MAFDISNDYVACRFLSVDADIENSPDSPDFYEANGFIRMTDKKYTKKTKIVCMYKDILPAEQLEFLLFLCCKGYGAVHRFCVLSEGWSSHELFHHGHDNLITVTVANIKEMYPVLVRL